MGGKTIKKGPSFLALAAAFGVGSLCGIFGLHLIQEAAGGEVGIRRDRFLRHLVRLFGAGVLIALSIGSADMLDRVLRASGYSTLLLFLFLPFAYLVLQVLWPGFLGKSLGTHRSFLCPQCYQRQDFRFQPVSFQFASWVTYLCPYCSCLANAWGEQVLYPSALTVTKVLKDAWRPVLPSLAALVLGVFFMLRLSGWV